jgi:hypothetical protein
MNKNLVENSHHQTFESLKQEEAVSLLMALERKSFKIGRR